MTLRKDKSTTGVVLIGIGFIGLLFFGIRSESVRVRQRARETILRKDLCTIREAIDNYMLDKHRRPKSLQELVDAGYFRAIPVDSTGKTDWLPDLEYPVFGDPVLSPDLRASLTANAGHVGESAK